VAVTVFGERPVGVGVVGLLDPLKACGYVIRLE